MVALLCGLFMMLMLLSLATLRSHETTWIDRCWMHHIHHSVKDAGNISPLHATMLLIVMNSTLMCIVIWQWEADKDNQTLPASRLLGEYVLASLMQTFMSGGSIAQWLSVISKGSNPCHQVVTWNWQSLTPLDLITQQPQKYSFGR